jgi:hypothetical protein
VTATVGIALAAGVTLADSTGTTVTVTVAVAVAVTVTATVAATVAATGTTTGTATGTATSTCASTCASTATVATELGERVIGGVGTAADTTATLVTDIESVGTERVLPFRHGATVLGQPLGLVRTGKVLGSCGEACDQKTESCQKREKNFLHDHDLLNRSFEFANCKDQYTTPFLEMQPPTVTELAKRFIFVLPLIFEFVQAY